MRRERWTLVLAGGAGRRLANLTGGRPKQFWSPNGGQTLIEETVQRTTAFAPASRHVTVIDRSHRAFVEALRSPAGLGRVVLQPEDRGTAAGVLLGLCEILDAAPNAAVLLTPADHGIVRTDIFRAGLREGLARIGTHPSRIVLFGIEPTSPDGEYGWVTPAFPPPAPVGLCVPVTRFVEKPHGEELARLYAGGAVWNTMVLVAHAETLLNQFRRHLPELTSVLTDARREPVGNRHAALSAAYAHLRNEDFSRDLVGRTTNLDLYTWPAAMGWSDLGTPDRVSNWQRRLVGAVA